MTQYLYPVFLMMLCLCSVSPFLGGCTDPAQSNLNGASRAEKPESKFESQRDQPPNAKTLYAMADILATQGKDSECELVLRRCIQQYPHFVPAYNNLAELEMRRGRPKEASKVLTLAVNLRPRDPVLLNNLGMSYLAQREYEKALEHFTNAASVAPDNGKYRANMATALGLLGRLSESAALLHDLLPEEEARHNVELLRQAHEKAVESQASAEDRSR